MDRGLGKDMMMDIQKQVAYWRHGAVEDWDVGIGLVEQGKIRHGLFFVHLALEKLLKAHVCRSTQDFAPKVHSLLRLAELSGLDFPVDHVEFLSRFDQYSIAGRYPGTTQPLPTGEETARDAGVAQEVFAWLTAQF
ncbi:MAG: HEPN domain-containing protein [Lentisphaeria bacterium]|nr:HEPN domain-containing protein [Lentisphaeria bacterium]